MKYTEWKFVNNKHFEFSKHYFSPLKKKKNDWTVCSINLNNLVSEDEFLFNLLFFLLWPSLHFLIIKNSEIIGRNNSMIFLSKLKKNSLSYVSSTANMEGFNGYYSIQMSSSHSIDKIKSYSIYNKTNIQVCCTYYLFFSFFSSLR